MKYKANCTYCISQVCNLYPDREKHRILSYFDKKYIEVETEIERSYIEIINSYMRAAIETYQHLENYIQDK